MTGLAAVLDALDHNDRSLADVADAETQRAVGRVVERARALATRPQAATEDRLAAVALLGRVPVDREILAPLVSPREPAAVQAAAAVALARIPGRDATAALIAAWGGASPALKSQILDLVISRDGGAVSLLDATISDHTEPVVAWQRYGKGQVLGIASNTLWKWAAAGHERKSLYGRFWRQAVRILARNRVARIEVKAAKPGASQPLVSNSSGCTKSKPWKGWFLFSMRPYMCTPQPLQAWRWIAALASTTLSFCAFALTESLSRGTTATSEKVAPAGFQHLVQPQTWLKATLLLMLTVTASLLHLHFNVPPAYPALPALTPPSTDG